jgi:hypothetical protein
MRNVVRVTQGLMAVVQFCACINSAEVRNDISLSAQL